MLDRPEWPQPGWFGDVQVGYLTPHVKDGLFNTVTTPSGRTDLVTLPTAPLGWTVSPTFLAGYRLPSGFGGLSLSYRFLDASGTNSTGGPDGLAALRTRLDVNQVDFAYTSREFTPLANWVMKWTLGMRLASIFWDSQATEPFAAAAAGSGVFLSRVSNHFIGLGPRFGVDVMRHFEASGLSLVGRLNFADLIGRIQQNYTEGFTATGANGSPLFASSPNSGSQSVPVLNAQFGLGWCPPSWKASAPVRRLPVRTLVERRPTRRPRQPRRTDRPGHRVPGGPELLSGDALYCQVLSYQDFTRITEKNHT